MVCQRKIDGLFLQPPSQGRILPPSGDHQDTDDKLCHVEGLIRQWLQSSPHLPKNCDTNMLRSFIRGAKFNLEITKKKLDNYFMAKRIYPEYFSERYIDHQDVKNALENTNIVFMPKLTENHERVCVMSLCNPDASKFQMSHTVKLLHMVYDLVLTSEIPANGEVVIFDASNLSPSHASKFISQALKDCLNNVRSIYALKVTQIHIVNAPSVIDTIVKAIKPFIHEKVRERIYVHKKVEMLKDHIDPKVLPEDYDGAQSSIQERKEFWKQVLRDNEEWFREQETVKLLGDLPSAATKSLATSDSSVCGLDGSFRRLEID